MHLGDRCIALIIRHFCKPEDDVRVKRQQCILVGSVVLMMTLISINSLANVPLGLMQPVVIPVFVSLLNGMGILAHAAHTKTCASQRMLYIGIMYYNMHVLYARGGCFFVPMIPIVAMLGPLLSIFLSARIRESLMWISVWVVGFSVIVALEINGSLPVPHLTLVYRLQVAPSRTAARTWTDALVAATLFYTIFGFIVHVYRAEVETSKTLQEEVQVFVRLSHEIRTPVTVISGMAELMREWTSLSNEQHCMISDLASSARRLCSVVNDLLLASHQNPIGITTEGSRPSDAPSSPVTSPSLTAGAISTEPDQAVLSAISANPIHDDSLDFNLREVVDMAMAFHLPLAESSNVSMYLDLSPHLPMHINGAKNRLLSILDHLLNNAVKFTSSSGSVTLRVSSETSSEEQGTCSLRFEVQDSGIGLSEEQINNILSFAANANNDAQLSIYRTTSIGFGLGCSIRMIQLWTGQSLHVTSNGSGQGATFWFTAPFTVRPQHLHTNGVNVLSTMHVLLIDDDDHSAECITQTCQSIGVASVSRMRFGNITEESYRSCGGMIFVPSATSPMSLLIQQASVLTVVAELHERFPHVRCVVSGPASLRPWCHEILHCEHLSNPPSAAALRSALEAVSFDPVRAAALASTPRNRSSLGMARRPLHSTATASSASLTANSGPSGSAVASALPDASVVVTVTELPSPDEEISRPLLLDRVALNGPLPASTSTMTTGGLHTEDPHDANGLQGNSASGEAMAPSYVPTILCVDDNPVVLRLLSMFIYKAGFPGTIDTATDGPQAIRLVQQNAGQYAMVVMDYNLPGMTGAQATSLMRQTYSMDVLPIVGLTAATNMHEVCIKAGMNAVLFKPFTAEKIRELLQQFVHIRR